MVTFAGLSEAATRIALIKVVRRRANYLSFDQLDRLLAGSYGATLGSLTVGELLDLDDRQLAHLVPYRTPPTAKLLPLVRSYVRSRGTPVRSSEVAQRLRVPRSAVQVALRNLVRAGVLERHGRTKAARYTLRETAP